MCKEKEIRREDDFKRSLLPRSPDAQLSGAESPQRSCSRSADEPLAGLDAPRGAQQRGSCAPLPLLVGHRLLCRSPEAAGRADRARRGSRASLESPDND